MKTKSAPSEARVRAEDEFLACSSLWLEELPAFTSPTLPSGREYTPPPLARSRHRWPDEQDSVVLWHPLVPPAVNLVATVANCASLRVACNTIGD